MAEHPDTIANTSSTDRFGRTPQDYQQVVSPTAARPADPQRPPPAADCSAEPTPVEENE